MNSKSSPAGGTVRKGGRSLQRLMYVAKLGFAAIGALGVGRAAHAEEPHGGFQAREAREGHEGHEGHEVREGPVEHFDRGPGPGAAIGARIDGYHERFAIGHRIDRLPDRSVPLVYRGDHYYVNDGVWFRAVGGAFIVAAAPIGAVVPVLPFGYTTLWVGARRTTLRTTSTTRPRPARAAIGSSHHRERDDSSQGKRYMPAPGSMRATRRGLTLQHYDEQDS